MSHPLRLLPLLALLAAPSAAPGMSQSDLVRPEVAFAYEVEALEDGVLELRWEIRDGYYLYKSKLGFESLTEGVELGEPELPAGEEKEDEFFGLQEIYRDEQTIRIPYTRAGSAPDTLELMVRSQGCADIGICFPPQRWTSEVALSGSADGGGFLDRIRNLGGAAGDERDALLAPEEAFRSTVAFTEAGELLVSWEIAEGYYLYRDQLAARTDTAGVELGQPSYPQAVAKTDDYFGDTAVYYDSVRYTLPVRFDGAPRAFALELDYQGCAEDRLCYSPQTAGFEVDPAVTVPASAVVASADTGPSAPASGAAGRMSEQDRIAAMIEEGDLLWIVLAFLGFGLLLTFTPCVLPMIPILSSIIAGEGDRVDTRRGFLLSLAYVQGVAVTFAGLGAVAGLAGENLQAAMQAPPVLWATALIFVLLSLAMFGFYELQVPAFIRERLDRLSRRQRGGNYLGVFIMGLVSALVVSPCVAPPLAGAVLMIAQTQDWLLGGLALYAMGLGMGVPLMIVGTTEGRYLPKAGPWMNAVKAVFGVMLLAVALWLLGRILPGPLVLVLWGLLALGSGIYMGALEAVPETASGWRRLWKTLGLALAAYGIAAFLGAAAGGGNPLQPLRPFTGGGAQQHQGLSFQQVGTVAELEAAVDRAAAQDRPVMFDFYADWCVSCLEMEEYTFSDPAVRSALEGVVLLQADVTENDEQDKELLRHFGIYGPPTIVFFDRDGREVAGSRVVGFMPAAEFADHVQSSVGDAP